MHFVLVKLSKTFQWCLHVAGSICKMYRAPTHLTCQSQSLQPKERRNAADRLRRTAPRTVAGLLAEPFLSLRNINTGAMFARISNSSNCEQKAENYYNNVLHGMMSDKPSADMGGCGFQPSHTKHMCKCMFQNGHGFGCCRHPHLHPHLCGGRAQVAGRVCNVAT